MQLAVNPVGNSRPDESLADMEWQAGTGVHGTLTPWERPVRRTSTTEGGVECTGHSYGFNRPLHNALTLHRRHSPDSRYQNSQVYTFAQRPFSFHLLEIAS